MGIRDMFNRFSGVNDLDPLEKFRQRNLLGTPMTQDPLRPQPPARRFGADTSPTIMEEAEQDRQAPPAPTGQFDAEKYYQALQKLQGQVGPGIEAYRQHLKALPDREAYRPGGWTRVASALSGFAAGMRNPGEGIKTAQDLNESDYVRALSDYSNKGVGLKASADMEQEELDSKIKMLQNARAMGLNYDKFALDQWEAQQAADVARQNAGANIKRADASWVTANKKDYTPTPQQDGSVLWTNNTNPNDKVVVGGKSIAAGTLGVARGNLGVAQGRLGEEKKRTGLAERAQSHRETQDMVDAGVRMISAQRGASTHIPTPAEQEKARDLAAGDVLRDMPEFAAYAKIDPETGWATIVPDDGSQDYQDFIEALQARVDEILAGGRARAATIKR